MQMNLNLKKVVKLEIKICFSNIKTLKIENINGLEA